MEENNGFQDIIGNKAAPNLNYLANTFGLETNYFGVSPCRSESNRPTASLAATCSSTA